MSKSKLSCPQRTCSMAMPVEKGTLYTRRQILESSFLQRKVTLRNALMRNLSCHGFRREVSAVSLSEGKKGFSKAIHRHGSPMECKATVHRTEIDTSPILSVLEQPRISDRKICTISRNARQTSLSVMARPAFDATVSVATILAFQLISPSIVSAATTESISNVQFSAFLPGLVGDSPIREGIVSGFLLIFFSEIGDKTFFIALLLALQQSRSLVFAGTFGALATMTVISVGLGEIIHKIDENIPNFGVPLDDLLAVVLLIFFGVQTLQSASLAKETADEEREEAKDVVAGMNSRAAALSMVGSTFALVFAAEWGDKSFLATIALAAASDPAGVILGAIAGHGIATLIAVLGGSFLGKYLSERVVQYIGGSLFLIFAAATLYDIIAGAQ